MCSVRTLRAVCLAFGDQTPDLVVDQLCRFLRHVLRAGDGMAEEHFLLVIAVADAAELIAHAPFHHHDTGQLCRLLDIARGARS